MLDDMTRSNGQVMVVLSGGRVCTAAFARGSAFHMASEVAVL